MRPQRPKRAMHKDDICDRLHAVIGQERKEFKDIVIGVKRYLTYLESLHHPGVPMQRITADRANLLSALRRKIGDCNGCVLSRSRTHLVFGKGNPEAKVVFVGEAPGRDEDLQGEPFVGAAGQLLTKMIQAMGFQRKDVYICNVVKCWPPGNRTPFPEEISACMPFLDKQLSIISPLCVISLGSVSAQALLDTIDPISKLRGRFHSWRQIPIMPTFHPAYLLRNPAMKKHVWDDFKKVMAFLKGK